MVDERRLYGRPGSEYMEFTPQSVYETIELDHYEAPRPGAREEIEEWSVHPPRHHLPSAAVLVEWLEEWASENGEVMGDFDVSFDAPAVRVAAEALLEAAAGTISWRMADVKLASHWVTWDDDGEPLLDGEPLYRKASE